MNVSGVWPLDISGVWPGESLDWVVVGELGRNRCNHYLKGKLNLFI